MKHILKKAQLIEKLYKNPDTIPAGKTFDDLYDSLAFIGGLQRGLLLLKKHDPETIDHAIMFLKADPYFFRSGYIKKEFADLLKKAPLSKKQISELQDALIATIQKESRREYRSYCKLAAKIADHKFRQRVQNIIDTSESAQRVRHAQWMLDALK